VRDSNGACLLRLVKGERSKKNRQPRSGRITFEGTDHHRRKKDAQFHTKEQRAALGSNISGMLSSGALAQRQKRTRSEGEKRKKNRRYQRDRLTWDPDAVIDGGGRVHPGARKSLSTRIVRSFVSRRWENPPAGRSSVSAFTDFGKSLIGALKNLNSSK